MKAGNAIAALILTAILSGCGVKKEEHQKVVNELTQAKQELEEVTSQLKSANEHVRQLSTEVERLKNQDAHAFRQAGKVLDAGELTAKQWWPILRGKTMQEVKQLLGTPNFTEDDDRNWIYWYKAVAPNSGNKDSLIVYFRGGVVRGVASPSLNSIIQE